MPAVDFDATDSPTDILAALSLSVGTAYSIQHVGTLGTVFVRASASAVTTADRGFKIEAGSVAQVSAQAGDRLYVWTDGPGAVPCILDTVP